MEGMHVLLNAHTPTFPTVNIKAAHCSKFVGYYDSSWVNQAVVAIL
jgi:hypothetical protein